MIEFCNEKGWKILAIFEDLGSSDSIDFRPEFKKMLDNIALELYDAVVVMDYDRLTRGDDMQRAIIKSYFKESKTLIVDIRDRL